MSDETTLESQRPPRRNADIPTHDRIPFHAPARPFEVSLATTHEKIVGHVRPVEAPMSRDTADSDSESGTLPDCPTCGSPIAMVTMTGPTDGVASPCGCQFVPDAHG